MKKLFMYMCSNTVYSEAARQKRTFRVESGYMILNASVYGVYEGYELPYDDTFKLIHEEVTSMVLGAAQLKQRMKGRAVCGPFLV